MIWRTIMLLVIGMLLLGALLVQQFMARLGPGPGADALPPVAIVFTGQFDRVELGLDLLERQMIDRLFISGVNQGAGILPEGFAQQFTLSPTAMTALEAGRIILAPGAESTLDNALEARCWLAQHPEITAVVLITGRLHMPRATTSLERALPRPITVRRLSPMPSGTIGHYRLMDEFTKFAATWFVTLLPPSLWPGKFVPACPWS